MRIQEVKFLQISQAASKQATPRFKHPKADYYPPPSVRASRTPGPKKVRTLICLLDIPTLSALSDHLALAYRRLSWSRISADVVPPTRNGKTLGLQLERNFHSKVVARITRKVIGMSSLVRNMPNDQVLTISIPTVGSGMSKKRIELYSHLMIMKTRRADHMASSATVSVAAIEFTRAINITMNRAITQQSLPTG